MKITIGKKQRRTSVSILTIGIILMAIGYIIDNGLNGTPIESYKSLGAVLFTIGFWFVIIPLIIILAIIAVMVIVVAFS